MDFTIWTLILFLIIWSALWFFIKPGIVVPRRRVSGKNKPLRYSHALPNVKRCSHQTNWGFEEDMGPVKMTNEQYADEKLRKRLTKNLRGDVIYRCHDCGLVWKGNTADSNMPQHIKVALHFARTH